MTTEGCPLCGGAASKTVARNDLPVFSWTCEQCGTFRLGLARELWLRRASNDARREEALRVRHSGAQGRSVMV